MELFSAYLLQNMNENRQTPRGGGAPPQVWACTASPVLLPVSLAAPSPGPTPRSAQSKSWWQDDSDESDESSDETNDLDISDGTDNSDKSSGSAQPWWQEKSDGGGAKKQPTPYPTPLATSRATSRAATKHAPVHSAVVSGKINGLPPKGAVWLVVRCAKL